MGVEVGFKFYKYKNGKLEDANIIKDYDGSMCNYLYICGRCEATYIFINLIEKFEKEESHLLDAEAKDKYSAYALLNHPELDGLEDHSNEEQWNGWYKKYFYIGLDEFKNNFDFKKAQNKHDELLNRLNEELKEMKTEIEYLRIHQENAKTKAAFDGFEEKIKELKEEITYKKEYIKDTEEDDYDYNHYMWIKEYIEQVAKIIEDDPDIVAVAFESY